MKLLKKIKVAGLFVMALAMSACGGNTLEEQGKPNEDLFEHEKMPMTEPPVVEDRAISKIVLGGFKNGHALSQQQLDAENNKPLKENLLAAHDFLANLPLGLAKLLDGWRIALGENTIADVEPAYENTPFFRDDVLQFPALVEDFNESLNISASLLADPGGHGDDYTRKTITQQIGGSLCYEVSNRLPKLDKDAYSALEDAYLKDIKPQQEPGDKKLTLLILFSYACRSSLGIEPSGGADIPNIRGVFKAFTDRIVEPNSNKKEIKIINPTDDARSPLPCYPYALCKYRYEAM